MKQDTKENKGELYSHGKEEKENTPAKEQIINSVERNLCVQLEEAKEGDSKDAAIIKVRFVWHILNMATFYITLFIPHPTDISEPSC
jgi:hypothetical protein